MNIRRFELHHMMRLVVLAVILTSLALAVPRGASAADSGDAHSNAVTEIQVCEAMGGEADVTVDRASDHLTTIVECNGGLMDGFNCINDTDNASGNSFTDCTQTRLIFFPEVLVVAGVNEIKSLDEPVAEPTSAPITDPVIVEAPVEVAPVDEPVAEPTAAPITDPVIDQPIVNDPIVRDGDAVAQPTAEPTTAPVVDDGAIAGGDLEAAPEVDGSATSDDGQLLPLDNWQPIEIKGLPSK
jgi:hypothetical protein